MRSGEVEVSCVTAPRNYPPSPRFATIAAHATATLTTATSSSSKGEAGIDSVDVTAALRDPLSQDAGPRTHFHYYSSGAVDHDGMPLLMAVRNQRFKLHLYTQGSHRPKTGRADWEYPDAALCAAALQNWTDAPLLFDLHVDPGENVPRTPCAGWDGTWPAPAGWHSGCMVAGEYVRSHRARTARVTSACLRSDDASVLLCPGPSVPWC